MPLRGARADCGVGGRDGSGRTTMHDMERAARSLVVSLAWGKPGWSLST